MGNVLQLLNPDCSKLERSDDELSSIEKRYLREKGKRLPERDRWFQGIDWYGIHINQDRVNRVIWGLRGEGAVGSIGGLFWRAAEKRPSSIQWAVTNLRFLLLSQRADVHTEQFAVYFELPRTSIVSVRHRGKLFFEWGRVELRFADGSMFSFMTSLLDFSAARQLTRAMSTTS